MPVASPIDDCDALLADLEAAAAAFVQRLEDAPEAWSLGPAGKWTAGQHAEPSR